MVESAWTGLHAMLWPFGFVPSPPVMRKITGTGPAPADQQDQDALIILVHGLVDNGSIFTILRRALRRRGFSRVMSMNYSLLTNDVPTAAANLGDYLEELCAATGDTKVRLVCHSLGGLIARYYIQRLGGDSRIEVLVTLGSPHQGTQLARFVPLRLAEQLRPGSDLLGELDRPVARCGTRMVAIYSPMDEVVVPGRNARIDHPDLGALNVPVPAVGHQSLPVHPRVIDTVCEALTTGRTIRKAA
ncbi:MAG: alpha/beta fold hydrolase [Actinocatenispora sp.]